MQAVMKRLLFVVVFAIGNQIPLLVAEELPKYPYVERMFDLPMMDDKGRCPVSTGDSTVVAVEHGYVFGAGSDFFGDGPVYFALSWKPSNNNNARFKLDARTATSAGFRLKTPWVMHPDYDGAALVRGAQMGSDTPQRIVFRENTQRLPVTQDMVLRSNTVGTIPSDDHVNHVDTVWRFWPSSMIIPGPGCYAIQIDTEHDSDLIVFEATRSD